jgi:Zn-dependent peptidase ImmA (M78 family)
MLYPNDYGSENDGTPTKVYFSRERMYSPHQPRDWEEWQADTLASYILMPEDLIRQGMFWLDMGEQINILNKKFSPYMYEKFCMLADMLGASRSALAYRMEKLGLIKENHLSNPYIVFDRINIIKED